jgi:hypothetical protein
MVVKYPSLDTGWSFDDDHRTSNHKRKGGGPVGCLSSEIESILSQRYERRVYAQLARSVFSKHDRKSSSHSGILRY